MQWHDEVAAVELARLSTECGEAVSPYIVEQRVRRALRKRGVASAWDGGLEEREGGPLVGGRKRVVGGKEAARRRRRGKSKAGASSTWEVYHSVVWEDTLVSRTWVRRGHHGYTARKVPCCVRVRCMASQAWARE